MTVRNAAEAARRRRAEAEARTREEGYNPYDSTTAVREDDSEYERLLREAPTAEELTPDLFLEDPYAVAAPESMAAQASASAATNYATDEALDLLMRQAQADAGSGIGYGERARMAMADGAFARGRGQAGAAADSQFLRSGASGSGAAIQDDMAGIGALNDNLLYNYAGGYNAAQGQEDATMGALASEAGGLRGQTFGEAFRRGSAVDAFNEHNLSFMRDVNQRNTDRTNRQSAEGEAAHQQTEDNEYNLHQGTAPIRQAERQISRDEQRQAEEDQMAAYDAITGTVRSVIG